MLKSSTIINQNHIRCQISDSLQMNGCVTKTLTVCCSDVAVPSIVYTHGVPSSHQVTQTDPGAASDEHEGNGTKE